MDYLSLSLSLSLSLTHSPPPPFISSFPFSRHFQTNRQSNRTRWDTENTQTHTELKWTKNTNFRHKFAGNIAGNSRQSDFKRIANESIRRGAGGENHDFSILRPCRSPIITHTDLPISAFKAPNPKFLGVQTDLWNIFSQKNESLRFESIRLTRKSGKK